MGCFECGDPATQDHHVVPQSLGGTKTVPLCDLHHGQVHALEGLNISSLTKQALAKRREAGVRLGRPPVVPDAIVQRVVDARFNLGQTFQQIADALNLDGIPTAHGGKQWYSGTVRNLAYRELSL